MILLKKNDINYDDFFYEKFPKDNIESCKYVSEINSLLIKFYSNEKIYKVNLRDIDDIFLSPLYQKYEDQSNYQLKLYGQVNT